MQGAEALGATHTHYLQRWEWCGGSERLENLVVTHNSMMTRGPGGISGYILNSHSEIMSVKLLKDSWKTLWSINSVSARDDGAMR